MWCIPKLVCFLQWLALISPSTKRNLKLWAAPLPPTSKLHIFTQLFKTIELYLFYIYMSCVIHLHGLEINSILPYIHTALIWTLDLVWENFENKIEQPSWVSAKTENKTENLGLVCTFTVFICLSTLNFCFWNV